MHRYLLLFAIALLAACAVGCTGAGNSPVSPPDNSQGLTAMINQPSQSPESSQAQVGHSLLGFWNCIADPDKSTLEFIPLRTTELHLNVVPFLEVGSMKIGLNGPIQVIDGVLHASVKLTHPFPSKPQLSGFDVKGVVITAGSEAGFTDTDIRIAGANETRLVNADGFTRWWNPAEFLNSGVTGYNKGHLGTVIDPADSAILNGYKLYADGLAADAALLDLDPAGRAFFQAGHTNSREFEISLAGGVKFNYAVDVSWAPPSPNPPVNLPGDFPPEANQSEPWFIQVLETNNTLWFQNNKHGGNVSYDVVVHDWQGISDIQGLTIECPGVFSDSVSSLTTIDDYTASCHFDFILPDLTSADPLDVLVAVQVPGDYAPGMTGVDKPLRAYYRHITGVLPEEPTFNQAPVAIMEATSPTEIFKDESVSFDATASYDPDGSIKEYLWDFNGNGIYGEEPYVGDPATPTHTFSDTGLFDVRVKVRDNGGKSDISDAVQVKVILDTNTPPVALAEATSPTTIDEDLTVSFDGSASYDLDGTVVDWKWDFNGDGDYNDPYTGDMQTPTATFPDPGTYYVDLKVIDNEAGEGVLDSKIKVTVNNVLINPVAEAQATTSTDIDNCGSVTFDASASYDTDGTITQYLWDFDGDDTFGDTYDSGTDTNPTKVFTAGAWNVQLKVVDNESLESTLASPIVVTATNIVPTADAVATTGTDILALQSVTFDASGSADPDCDDIALYEWDFDGDGVFGDAYDSGTVINPTKTYSTMGVYPVSLRVTDGEGATDVIDAPITVNVLDNPPTACAEIKTTWPYFWNTNIQFSGECSSDIDGTIISWEWDLGADGSYEQSGETAVFNFPTAGAYQMQLRVTDNDGGTALLDTPLSFQIYDDSNWPPIVTKVNHSRTTSTMGSATETVTLGVDFDDPVPPGDTHTYLWSCPYGAFDDPTSATPVWTPPNQVVKCQITVRVIDSFGMWDEGTCNQWVTQWPILFNPYAPGNIIYSQSLDTADDGFVNPSTYKFPDVQPDGNVIYCNFWATWCGPCMNEMPDLSTIYDMYKDQQYAHLLIDVGESKQTVVNFVNSHNYHATHWPLDPGNAYYSIMVYWTTNPGYIPTSLVFDRDGYCRAQYVGTIPSISTLTQYIDELI